MALNDRIAEAIRESGKSFAEIARDCGVTSAAVTHWKNGETKSLKAETALALEQATGFRAVWILQGLGPRKVTEPAFTWPFPKVPLERIEALPEDDRGYVQRKLMQAIAECEEMPSTEAKPPEPSGGDVLKRYGIPLYPDRKHAPKKRA